ncbi:Urease [Forsythia ovata]|uniref:urease n=1 Tax=Forsythia ovata TaxID=205694 RepID=A0ABD1WG22_9LAMI
MKLTPREIEKLMLHNAGYLAQKRLARGLRLNYTEAVALIATQILEFVHDGDKSVADLMDLGRQFLGRAECFRLAVPSLDKFPTVEDCKVPGEIICGSGLITLNYGRKAILLKVANTGDRPIQVGSHYHFIEVNPFLVFDRRRAYGMRLNILAGTATRFEPGDAKSVTLVRIGGKQVIRGGNGIVDGPVDDAKITSVMEAVHEGGFGVVEETNARLGSFYFSLLSREQNTLFGFA